MAEKIAKKGALAVQAGKEAVLASASPSMRWIAATDARSVRVPAQRGHSLRAPFVPRSLQHGPSVDAVVRSLTRTQADKKEGMSAFVEKRKAKFTHS